MASLAAWWRSIPKVGKVALSIGAVFVALLILGAALPSSDDGGEEASPPPPAAQESPPPPPPPPSNRADDDNEPHVGANRSVIVDTLEWRVLSARRAKALGSDFSRETPDGLYVVVTVQVRNGKDESVTLTSDQVKYEVGDKTYSYDSEGTIALSFESDDLETFFLKDLGPDVTTKGSVAFDVPAATVRQKPEICFGELGFGSTKGCIRLRSL